MAFSLLQMLAVLAIVTALILVGSTLFNIALERAREVRCVGNLRQIGVALMRFAAENNARIPARIERKNRDPNENHDSSTYWYRILEAYLPPMETPGSNVFICPSLPLVQGAPIYYQTYGYRLWRKPGSYDDEDFNLPQNLLLIEKPSDFFLMTDSYVSNFNSQGYFVAPGTTWMPHLRHSHVKANTLMADGHIEAKGKEYFDRISTEQEKYYYPIPYLPFYLELERFPQ